MPYGLDIFEGMYIYIYLFTTDEKFDEAYVVISGAFVSR